MELRTTNEGADNPQSKDSTAAAILADDPKQEPLPSTTGTHMMEGDLTRNGRKQSLNLSLEILQRLL